MSILLIPFYLFMSVILYVGRNVMGLICEIQAFQHVRKTNGTKATSSGWRPGKPILKPRPDLVGKVWRAWKMADAF
jgi:alkyl hydroperoxide reductase subunit AhpC